MKKIIAVLMVLVFVLGFAGCGGGEDTSSGDVTTIDGGAFAAEDLANYVCSNVEFADYMEGVDAGVLNDIYGIDAGMVADEYAYFSTGATAEEITVVTLNDAGDMAALKEIYQNRIDAQKSSFENYVPEELTKLETPVILEAGNSLVMVVCNDAASAESAVTEFFNK